MKKNKVEIEKTKLKYVIFPVRMDEELYKKIKMVALKRDSDASKIIRSFIRFGLKYEN